MPWSDVLRRRGSRCAAWCATRGGWDRSACACSWRSATSPTPARGAMRCAAWTPSIHLAGGARDQPGATVEELNGLAAWRLLRAAERVRARHFVWIMPLGATPHHPMRMQRAKALAAAALAEATIPTTVFAHSLVYAPGDRHLRWLERLGYLPAVPLVGRGIARTQPLWAEDAAECILAALDRRRSVMSATSSPGRRRSPSASSSGIVLAAAGRRRRTIPLPLAGLRAGAARRGDARRPGVPGHLGRRADARGRDAQRPRDEGRREPRRPTPPRRRCLVVTAAGGAPRGAPPPSATRPAAAGPR